jgi:hypothetical protein
VTNAAGETRLARFGSFLELWQTCRSAAAAEPLVVIRVVAGHPQDRILVISQEEAGGGSQDPFSIGCGGAVGGAPSPVCPARKFVTVTVTTTLVRRRCGWMRRASRKIQFFLLLLPPSLLLLSARQTNEAPIALLLEGGDLRSVDAKEALLQRQQSAGFRSRRRGRDA